MPMYGFPSVYKTPQTSANPPVSASVLWQHGEDEKCVWQNEALRSATGMSQIHWSHFTSIFFFPENEGRKPANRKGNWEHQQTEKITP